MERSKVGTNKRRSKGLAIARVYRPLEVATPEVVDELPNYDRNPLHQKS